MNWIKKIKTKMSIEWRTPCKKGVFYFSDEDLWSCNQKAEVYLILFQFQNNANYSRLGTGPRSKALYLDKDGCRVCVDGKGCFSPYPVSLSVINTTSSKINLWSNGRNIYCSRSPQVRKSVSDSGSENFIKGHLFAKTLSKGQFQGVWSTHTRPFSSQLKFLEWVSLVLFWLWKRQFSILFNPFKRTWHISILNV